MVARLANCGYTHKIYPEIWTFITCACFIIEIVTCFIIENCEASPGVIDFGILQNSTENCRNKIILSSKDPRSLRHLSNIITLITILFSVYNDKMSIKHIRKSIAPWGRKLLPTSTNFINRKIPEIKTWVTIGQVTKMLKYFAAQPFPYLAIPLRKFRMIIFRRFELTNKITKALRQDNKQVM